MKDDARERLPRTTESQKSKEEGRRGRRRWWTRALFGQIGEIWGLARRDARNTRKEARILEPRENEQPAPKTRKPLIRRWYAYALVLVALGLLAATAQQSYHLLGSLNQNLAGKSGQSPAKKDGSPASAEGDLSAGKAPVLGTTVQKSGQKAAGSSQEAVGRLKQGVQKELGNQLEANSSQGSAVPQGSAIPAASRGGSAAATTTAGPAPAPQPAERFGNLVWPVRGDTTISFGWKKHPVFGDWRFHDGLDLAVPAGTPVVAVFSGTVVEASRMPVPYHSKADAYTVIIEHDGGWRSTYGLLSQTLVAKGDRVSRGKVIGRAGVVTGGEGTGEALLHFALARDGGSVDPKTWLP
ncbi:MAG: peptidoglycan DD-metalloendopeptidase family protein [Syntrophothermus sp.]